MHWSIKSKFHNPRDISDEYDITFSKHAHTVSGLTVWDSSISIIFYFQFYLVYLLWFMLRPYIIVLFSDFIWCWGVPRYISCVFTVNFSSVQTKPVLSFSWLWRDEQIPISVMFNASFVSINRDLWSTGVSLTYRDRFVFLCKQCLIIEYWHNWKRSQFCDVLSFLDRN